MSPPLLRSGAQPALPAIPKSVDRRPPWQVACRLRLRREGGQGTRSSARRRAVCQGSRDGSWREKNKPRHRRGSCRLRGGKEQGTSPLVPSGTKKKEKGRFGVGAGLRGQILDRPPILGGSVGPSKAPLAYIVLRPPVGHRAHGTRGEKNKGQVRSWGGASRSDPRSAADPRGIGRTE